jgi:hypothetical protein
VGVYNHPPSRLVTLLKVTDAPIQMPNIYLTISFKFLNFSFQIYQKTNKDSQNDSPITPITNWINIPPYKLTMLDIHALERYAPLTHSFKPLELTVLYTIHTYIHIYIYIELRSKITYFIHFGNKCTCCTFGHAVHSLLFLHTILCYFMLSFLLSKIYIFYERVH